MYTRIELLRLVYKNSGYNLSLETIQSMIRKNKRGADAAIKQTFGNRLQYAAMGRWFIV